MTPPPDATAGDGPPASPASAGRVLEKQERLARVYDAEVWPLLGQRLGALLLAALDVRPAARVVDVGCATGTLTLELARRFDAASHVLALDEVPYLAQARLKLDANAVRGARVTFDIGSVAPLSLPDASADIVVSNLAVGDLGDPARAVRELARVLAPGGQVVITTPLRGTWGEFLDLYRDVLLENGTPASVASLDQYVASLPDGPAVAGWLEAAGLTNVEVSVERWEILFRSAREFFYAPVVELGPLSRWKRIAGRGEDMQDVFFFTKEAIDTYFKGASFAVTIVGAAIKGWKPISPAP